MVTVHDLRRQPRGRRRLRARGATTDSVGLALLVVLETLSPAERLAFVLHDIFGMPFDEIGGKVVEVDLLADPPRLRRLDLTVLDD